jgi:hypothetical protein
MRSPRQKALPVPPTRRRGRLTATLDIRIDPRMVADLKRVAELEERTVADVVRRWLDHSLTGAIRRYERTGRWVVAFCVTHAMHRAVLLGISAGGVIHKI